MTSIEKHSTRRNPALKTPNPSEKCGLSQWPRLFLMLLLAAFSSQVWSLERQVYGGIAGGISELKPETGTTTHQISDDSDGAMKLFVGYDLTDYLSIEGFYGSYGAARLMGPTELTTTGTNVSGLGNDTQFLGSSADIVEGTVDYTALGAYGVVQFPNNGPGWSGILKLGVAQITSDSSNLPFRQADETKFTTAFGAEYQLKNGVAMRAEFDYVNEHVQAINLSVLKRFGKPKTNARQVIPPPKQAVAKPQPKPKPKPKPAAPKQAAPKPQPKPAPKPAPVAPVQTPAPVVPAMVMQQPQVIQPVMTAPQHVMTFTDRDLDGVPDGIDQCPYTPVAVVVNPQGCSYSTTAQVQPGASSGVLNGVTFHPGSARLTEASKRILEGVAAQLIGSANGIIAVVGHTDNRGSAAANMKLSQQRALAVTEFLAGQGIDENMLRYAGKGETMPLASNDTAAGRALNRRVELFSQY